MRPASATADTAPDVSQEIRLPGGSGGTGVYWKLISAVLRTESPGAGSTAAMLYYSAGGNAAFGAGSAAFSSALSATGTSTYEVATAAFTGSLATAGLLSGSLLTPEFTALSGSQVSLETEWEET